jgi:hypothetical protein
MVQISSIDGTMKKAWRNGRANVFVTGIVWAQFD